MHKLDTPNTNITNKFTFPKEKMYDPNNMIDLRRSQDNKLSGHE